MTEFKITWQFKVDNLIIFFAISCANIYKNSSTAKFLIKKMQNKQQKKQAEKSTASELNIYRTVRLYTIYPSIPARVRGISDSTDPGRN